MTDNNELVTLTRIAAQILRDIGGQSAMAATVDEAADAIEAARADAARYRWLRGLDGACDSAACVNFNIGFDWIEQHGDELDAAVDAAMAAEGRE